MKRLKIIIILIAVLVPVISLPAQNWTNEKGQMGEIISNSDTLTFTVYGMDCPGCEDGLEKQVFKIPSVGYCKANWLTQELKIVIKQDSVLNLVELDKRIKKANFTLDTNPKKRSDEN